jgi:hypothetical protein
MRVEVDSAGAGAVDRLAFDRSTRRIDAEGRLHVAVNNITKACVNGYSGAEIMKGAMNGESLSLDPNRQYMLLRAPEELKKALPTANNIQLLRKHVGVSAADPKHMDIVGSTGTNAEWVDPYIQNSLVVWEAKAIAGVDTEMQCQLSSSYRYNADMTPGEYKGEKYDGVMRDIAFNHVALVEVGRAGPDVLVGDEKPSFKDVPPMAVTKKAALAAIAAAFNDQVTRLASDAAPAVRKTLIKLAADAKKEADDCDETEMAADEPVEFKGMPKTGGKMVGDKAKDEKPDDQDEDETDEEYADRKKREAEDRKKARDSARAAKDRAKDESAEEKEKREARERSEKAEDKAKDRKAMDSAIATAIAANDAKHRDIATAREAVRPFVGDVLAMDSAEEIYRLGCQTKGIDLTDVPTGSPLGVYRALLNTAASAAPGLRLATDSGGGDAAAKFQARFPAAVIPRRA